jgi:hypothetical protein
MIPYNTSATRWHTARERKANEKKSVAAGSGMQEWGIQEDTTVARKFDPEKLKRAAADWDIHHALVAGVRRLVKLAGGPQEAKDVIDAIVAADALEEEKEEGK